MQKSYLIAGLLVLFLGLGAHAQSLEISDQSGKYNLTAYISICSVDSAVAEEAGIADLEFVPIESQVANLGVGTSTHYIKFSIDNQSSSSNYFVNAGVPWLDDVSIYQVIDGKAVYMDQVSNSLPYDARAIKSQDILFELDLPIGEESSYIFKVHSADQVIFPLTLLNPEETDGLKSRSQLFYGLFFGIMMVMILYNLFIFFSTRDKSYIYLSIYIFALICAQTFFLGFGYRIFWPDSPFIEEYAVYIVSAFVGISAMIFFNVFLDAKKTLPVSYKILFVIGGAFIAVNIMAFVGLKEIAYQLLQACTGLAALFLLRCAFVLWRKGNRQAKYYMIASSVTLVCVVIFILKDFGVFPFNFLTFRMISVGAMIEVTLLSIAVADKINVLQKEKTESQAQALEALQENERIVREQNVMLEKKVSERTSELQSSNNNLNQALTDLKNTQAQLVDAEKMASLGQMTAGIAHEINNPINFVTSNISPLKRDIEDVFEILGKYEELKEGEGIKVQLDEIEELKEDLELDYLKEEIESLLKGINEGANRTSEIVKGLRVFSRLDEDALKKANINECIESTLVILRSNTKDECQISSDFDPNLPEINCFPGKLNQVVMNIVNNAIHATMAATENQAERKVGVKTVLENEHIIISIKDNGVGIDEAIKSKIFDPFFTTKDVGEGTGLGLSIALGIMQDHKGRIEVHSAVGEGSEFILTLPTNL
jgi:signal transduction histidine kinase